jgi:hypothetical protein
VSGSALPISGSTVTLYAAGTTGYGAGASVIGRTTTAANGTYAVSYTCPAANPETYIIASGGNAGAGVNSAISLMAALGPCNSLSTSTTVTINELTTAASAWALAQFFDASGHTIGAPATNAIGLQNAYIGFANLADVNASTFAVSGNPSSFLPTGAACNLAALANCDGLERLDTLANILAGCVESSGSSSSACAQLLCAGTPGLTFGSSCSGTPAPTDTMGAARLIVTNPANNVSALYGLAAASTPFSPPLTAAPDGWEMALNFVPAAAAFNSPLSIAVDSSGNVFVVNIGGESVSELTAASGYATGLNFAPAGAAFDTPYSIALDGSANVFVANFSSPGSVSELTATSGYRTGLSFDPAGAAFGNPTSIALDGSGNVFVANTSDSVSELTAASGYATGLNFDPAGAAFDYSYALALDQSANVFVANLDGGVSELTAASGYATGLSFAPSGAAFVNPTSIALDGSANVFVTNQGSGVSELTAASSYGTGLNFVPAGAAFNEPNSIALDGSGNIFAANDYGGIGETGSVSELTAASGYRTGFNFVAAGAALSFPGSIALDGSGNVFVANEFGNSVSEILGLAEPVVTPLQSALSSVGTAPSPAPTSGGSAPTPTPASASTPTPVGGPTPTPIAIVCPPAAAAPDGLTWTSAKVQSKPPTIKAFKFAKQPLDSASAPLQGTLTNTTLKPLTITNVAVSGDFIQNNGCIGEQLAAGSSCYVSIMFSPKHSGTRTGTLTITTSGPKVTTSLSGTGLAPTVLSISSKSQAALGQVTFKVSGYASTAPVLVSFTEKLASGKKGLVLPEAAGQNNGALIAAVVPPVIDPTSGELVAGSATVSVQELLPSGNLSAKSPPLKISLPATTSGLATGTVVSAFLQQEQSFATQLETNVQGTQLGTAGLESSLSSIASQSGAVLALLGGVLNNSATGVQLGSVGGVNVTVGTAQLLTADDQLLSTLQTVATGGGSQATVMHLPGATVTAQSSAGCLAQEAATALSDNKAGNATAFAADIANLFQDSETSPACQQPGAAAAAAGIINGGGAAALSLLAQAVSPQANSVVNSMMVPGQALVYSNLGPASQLVGIGVALAQTSSQDLQSVASSIKSFNVAASGQLGSVISNTQGATLLNSFNAVSQANTSFDEAVQPLDGAYAGSFSGNEFVTIAGCPNTVSAPLSGTLSVSVSGATITATIGVTGAAGNSIAASGTVDDSSGTGSFTIGGSGAACTFTGTFAAGTSGAATASGTWSCSVTGAATSGLASFSASGYWSVARPSQ